MQTITIELLDNQAIGLLRQLEKILWLRIVEPEVETPPPPRLKLSGSIPQDIALDMQKQLVEIRTSWERDF